MNASPAAVPPSVSGKALDATLLSALLNGTKEYLFFKDRSSRFLAVSQSLVRAFGCRSAADVIGRTDFDFYAREHAQPTFDDEQEIMRSGLPIVGKLEEQFWPTGRVTWVVTNKAPLRDAHGAIIGTFGLSKDITAQKQMEADLEKVHRDLVEASRAAGMAEVATGVLHNVGNVLNSLNVSASVIATGLRQSKAESLARVANLLQGQGAGLAEFVTHDAKGRRIPEFLSSLAQHATQERDRLAQEVSSLQRNVDHIKEVVAMQQTYATMIGVTEALDPVALVEDALRMNAGALQRHDVRVERDFPPVPRVVGEQAKVLQILVNLIRNAQHACNDTTQTGKRITLRLRHADNRVQLIVQDNGVGIPAENITRIFQHGFTTRPSGHGFGLHSAAIAAREMKGSITARSDGPGQGATFIVELPAANQEVAA